MRGFVRVTDVPEKVVAAVFMVDGYLWTLVPQAQSCMYSKTIICFKTQNSQYFSGYIWKRQNKTCHFRVRHAVKREMVWCNLFWKVVAKHGSVLFQLWCELHAYRITRFEESYTIVELKAFVFLSVTAFGCSDGLNYCIFMQHVGVTEGGPV
jgi:hypothetical protein